MPRLAPSATYYGGGDDNNYYLRKDNLPPGIVLDEPVLISLVGLRSADLASTASLSCGGLSAGAPGPYTGSISLLPAASSAGPACVGVAARSIATGCQVEIGTNAQAENKLMIAGPSQLSQVYDQKYNPPINPTPVIDNTFTLNSAAPGTSLYQAPFTPTQSGAYCVQVDVNLYNVDTIPTVGAFPGGALEWTVTSADGETQYMSSTFSGDIFTKASQLVGVAEPMDYTVSNIGFLTAGVPYQFNMYALNPVGGLGAWNLSNIKVRVIRMC